MAEYPSNIILDNTLNGGVNSFQVEEKDKKIFEKEAAITKTVSELKQSKENVEKVEKALRQSKIDVNVFCMHLKETEQALNDEAEKLMKRDEELAESKDKVKKLEFELKDKECEIVLLQEQNARFKEKRILQEQCSFNSETFQRRSKHRTQPEPKRIKEEPVAVAPTKRKSIRRTSKVQNILFNDTADDLLSEVSFGSQAENITTVDHRKPTQKSSTPKAVNALVHKRAKSATRRSGNLRKSKHIKKETENKTNDNWWENDSVYGFRE